MEKEKGEVNKSKDPGLEDPALVIPGGDLVYWHLNDLRSNGVMEYWSNGKTKTCNLVRISESFKPLALNMVYAACVHQLSVRIVI